MIPNLDIFVFLPNLQLEKFEGAGFKYDNNFFQIAFQKYPYKAFLVRKLRIFIFAPTLQQDKFQDTDSKHYNNIFKFQPKNTQFRHFRSQI